MKKLILILVLIIALFIAGCAQTQYVCPDGTTVDDLSMCEEETIETDTTDTDVKEDIVKEATKITTAPYCGDGICATDYTENCDLCPKDCGICTLTISSAECETSISSDDVYVLEIRLKNTERFNVAYPDAYPKATFEGLTALNAVIKKDISVPARGSKLYKFQFDLEGEAEPSEVKMTMYTGSAKISDTVTVPCSIRD